MYKFDKHLIGFDENEIILDFEMYLAWLFNRYGSDISDIENQKEFIVWFYLFGKKKYIRQKKITEQELSIVNELVPLKIGKKEVNLPRMARFLWQNRDDLKDAFPLKNRNSTKHYMHWFWSYGVYEYQCYELIDKKTIKYLNRTCIKYKQNEPVKLTNLMWSVYQIRDDLQQEFNLQEHSSRCNYVAWFLLHAVQQLNLKPLLSDGFITSLWYKTDGILSNFAQLIWLYKPDLQQKFNINNAVERKKYSNWFDLNSKNSPVIKGLKSVAPYKTEHIEQSKGETLSNHGINLIGYPKGELGIGEDLRMFVQALKFYKIPFTIYDVGNLLGLKSRQSDETLDDFISNLLPYKINIFCLTAFDTALVYLRMGKAIFDHHYNIGYWQWELSSFPKLWQPVFDLVDEIWVSSNFVRSSFRRSIPKALPLFKTPLPVVLGHFTIKSRKAFFLPEEGFIFLAVFDLNSYIERKNPIAVLSAFKHVFIENKDVFLVIKVMNAEPDSAICKRIESEMELDSRIILINKIFTRANVLALINICDAFVSLHRSEGFGRLIAEAMLLEKPVIVTNYSGNKDFVSQETGYPVSARKVKLRHGQYPFCDDTTYWGEPDIVEAANTMYQVYLQKGDNHKGKAARKLISSQYSPQKTGRLIKKRLQANSFFTLTEQKTNPRLRSVNQYRSRLKEDKIFVAMRLLQKLLMDMGYDSEIYTDNEISIKNIRYHSKDNYRANSGQVLLYHYIEGEPIPSGGEDSTDIKVLIYHSNERGHTEQVDNSIKPFQNNLNRFLASISFSYKDYQWLNLSNIPYNKLLPTLPTINLIEKEQKPKEKESLTYNLLFRISIVSEFFLRQVIKILVHLCTNVELPKELKIWICLDELFSQDKLFWSQIKNLIQEYPGIQVITRQEGKGFETLYLRADIFIYISESGSNDVDILRAMKYHLPVLAYTPDSRDLEKLMGQTGIILKTMEPEVISTTVSLLYRNVGFRKAINDSQQKNLNRLAPNQQAELLIKYVEQISCLDNFA